MPKIPEKKNVNKTIKKVSTKSPSDHGSSFSFSKHVAEIALLAIEEAPQSTRPVIQGVLGDSSLRGGYQSDRCYGRGGFKFNTWAKR